MVMVEDGDGTDDHGADATHDTCASVIPIWDDVLDADDHPDASAGADEDDDKDDGADDTDDTSGC